MCGGVPGGGPILLVAALGMIQGGWVSDAIGLVMGDGVFLWQRRMASTKPLTQSGDA